jgi:tetratricopeptide (TPR) repeat protein
MNIDQIPYNMNYMIDEDLREKPEDRQEMLAGVQYLKKHFHQSPSAQTAGLIGVYCRMTKQLTEAEAYLQQAQALHTASSRKQSVIVNQIRLAHVYQWQGRFTEADRLFISAIRQIEQDSDLEGYLDFAYQHYGKNLFDQHRYKEALQCFNRALAIREDKADPSLTASTQQAIEQTNRRMDRGVWTSK